MGVERITFHLHALYLFELISNLYGERNWMGADQSWWVPPLWPEKCVRRMSTPAARGGHRWYSEVHEIGEK